MTDDTGGDSLWIDLDRSLPHVTPKAVSEALKDLNLTFTSGKDFAWLAIAVRRVLAISIQEQSDGPDRLKNADIQRELARLSDMALSTWQAAFERTDASDTQLRDFAFDLADSSHNIAPEHPIGVAEPIAYRRLKSALSELEWVGNFLRRAAQDVEHQKPNWRRKVNRDLSVMRGCYLAPIFETAFSQPISVNAWPSDSRHKHPTAFMAFYQSMIALAFGEHSTPDISGVLKEARRLHLETPTTFSKGIVPEE